MSRFFFVVFFLLCSTQTKAHWLDADCSDSGYDYSELFKLGINRSFHLEKIYFIFCDAKTNEKSSYLLVLIDEKNGHDNQHFTIAMEDESIAVLKEKFELAWDYNSRDATSGLDGSYWCLETRRQMTYTKGCFYSPQTNAEERGLSGLSSLGRYLWEQAGLEKQYGELF